MRQALAVLLAVIAGLAAVAGVASWQLRSALAEPEGFGDRVLSALDDPQVRRAVAAEIAAQAVAAGAPAGERTTGLVESAIATPAFRQRFRSGAEALHVTLVERGEAGALRVDLGEPLRQADPQLGALLGDIGDAEVVVVEPGDLPVAPARAADALSALPT
ncbi:MAG TPA: hypothetical protein VIL49_05775, partial [Capillimicrobium sp.]